MLRTKKQNSKHLITFNCLLVGVLLTSSFLFVGKNNDVIDTYESDPLYGYSISMAPLTRPEDDEYRYQTALMDVGVFPDREYTGDGVKVGIVENLFVNTSFTSNQIDDIIYGTDNGEFEDQIDEYVYIKTFRNDDVTEFDAKQDFYEERRHATNVSIVAVGNDSIAKDATLYSASTFKYRTDKTKVFDWFADNDVNVINSSIGIDLVTGTYDGDYNVASTTIDDYIYNNGFTYVQAIGNRNESTTISKVALALNALSVGASDSDLEYSSSINASNFNSNYGDIVLAPKLLAPGEDIYKVIGINEKYNSTSRYSLLRGTSYAAPIVTGIVALLMEQEPLLKTHPELVMALLCNTATKAEGQTEFVDNKHGFGIVNYAEAQSSLDNLRSYELPKNTPDNTLISEEHIYIGANETLDITSFVLFDPSNVEIDNDYDADNVAVPSSIDFSKIKLELVDTMTNLSVYSDYISNFSYLNYKNTLYGRTFKLRVHLDGEQKEDVTKIGLHFNITESTEPTLEITDGNYLDETPTFTYNVTNYNRYYETYNTSLIIESEYGEVAVRKDNLSSKTGSVTLNTGEWASVIDNLGRKYYAYLKYQIGDDTFYSKAFAFYEPTEFNNLLQIRPSDYGFEAQYFFYSKTTTHVFDDITITANRLRAGYIEDTYINLSPRRENAGVAYLQLNFNKPIYGFSIGLTVWTEDEDVTLTSALIRCKNASGTWTTDFNILTSGVLPTNRRDVYRYSNEYTTPIYGIEIYVTSAATGDRNWGRLSIDDIVLLRSSDETFISTNYESIVEDTSYDDLLNRY